MRSRQLRAMKVFCCEGWAVTIGSPGLSRVKLDDQLLADRQGEILARGERRQLAFEVVLVQLEPFGHAATVDRAQALQDARDLLRLVLDLDLVVGAAEEGRDVHLLPVDAEV